MNLTLVKNLIGKGRDFISGSVAPNKNAKMMKIDQSLICAVVGLLMFGLIMVYSASIALPDSPKYAKYAGEHFFIRQAIFIFIGIVAAVFVFRFKIEQWEKFSPYLLMIALVLLFIVLIPGMGNEVKGGHRWISLKLFNLQPTEIMKLCMVLYAASYAIRKQNNMHRFLKGFFPIMGILMLVAVLIMGEPDLGALIVIFSIALGLLFLGGFNLIWFSAMLGLVLTVFVSFIIFTPWRLARFFAYLDPWNEINALSKGYQLSHSLIAFGRGEFFGVGLGASVEKLHYLPEAHTDFIIAVVGEELGFVGVCVVIAIFYWIVKRAFEIGRQAIVMEKLFAGLVAQGIGIWIGAQTFINMGVNLGLLPTKGLTLPFMSYGGSGIVTNCVAIAILLRIDYENRKIMRGGSSGR